MLRQERLRVAEILDLFEADDAAELAFALAAAAHVKAHRDIAELAQHPRRLQHIIAFTVRAETMQHDESRAPFLWAQAARNADGAMQAQAGGLKADRFFFHG